jgi:hypothetical protein
MLVGVIHRISDPGGFDAADASAVKDGLPHGFSRPIRSTTPDQTTGICIWHAESIEGVRALEEQVVGAYSTNEYFELNVKVDRHAMGG